MTLRLQIQSIRPAGFDFWLEECRRERQITPLFVRTRFCDCLPLILKPIPIRFTKGRVTCRAVAQLSAAFTRLLLSAVRFAFNVYDRPIAANFVTEPRAVASGTRPQLSRE